MSILEAKKCTTCGNTFDSSLSHCPNDGQRLVLIDALIGQTLDGRYRIESVLGRGGMGVVYRATHIHIDSEFAVKVLSPDLVANQAAIERFRREARAAGRIRHPNAIQVTDFGVTGERIVYLVMEIVDGKSLRELIDKQGAFDYRRAVNIMHQVCAAVEAAHQSGVIHRDLKPDNIVIKRVGNTERVKVLDFGIAKLKEKSTSSAAGPQQNLTEAGTIIGTPQYMSPEQCHGRELDPRSDIYSLGIILYEMLSGHPPFTADTSIGVVIKHLNEIPRPLRQIAPQVPEAIEAVVMRAIEKDPARRQSSAAELGFELEEAVRATEGGYKTGGMTAPLPQDDAGLPPGRPTAGTVIDTSLSGLLSGSPAPGPPTQPGQRAPSDKGAGAPQTRLVSAQELAGVAPESGTVGIQAGKEQAASGPARALGRAAVIEKPAKSKAPIIAIAAIVLVAVLGIGIYFVKPSLAPPKKSDNKSVDVTVDMVYIPGGKFIMGRDDGDEDERPAHEVEVKPFYIDKYEVTNQEYKKFVDATGHPAPRNWTNNGSYAPDQARLPVTYVTWQDAADYARWAGKRLPSEEEWEYAARGGSKGYLYPWGNEWKEGYANVSRKDRMRPTPVGSYDRDQSPFGVYDMAGNVSEWVHDFFKKYGGKADERWKVFRGGNFVDGPDTSTTTYRWYDYPNPPADILPKLGFRCAKDADK